MSTSVPWLINIVRRAGLTGADALRPDPRAGLADSWRAVARQCGISEDELVVYVAGAFKMKVADFRSAQAHALKLVPEKIVRAHQVLPLREDDRVLVVATADPTNPDSEQALGFASGRRPEFEVASPQILQLAIESRYAPEQMVDALLETLDPDHAFAAAPSGSNPDLRFARLANLILQEAVRQNASQVIIEPGGAGAIVRFRVDGVLRNPSMQLPMLALSKLIVRLKASAGLTGTAQPDTRSQVNIAGQMYNIRMSTTDSRDGERAVIQLVDAKAAHTLQDLGISAQELAKLRELLAKRNGLVVISAPPNSGATTTVYAALREIAAQGRSVVALEERMEYELSGVHQLQIDFSRRANFIAALSEVASRAPDAVFISDIRDADAARAAIETSAERLVIVAMHTSNAVAVPRRLVDLGLERERVADLLRGVFAQRLMRRICTSCGEEIRGFPTVEEAALSEKYGVRATMRGAGCVRCANTGYKSRIPVAEVLTVTSEIAERIRQGISLETPDVAKGMRTLEQVAAERVVAGETSLREVDRVLGGGGGSLPKWKPHVLLVDDDAVTRLYVRQLLENEGYAVSEAADGLNGLEQINAADDLALVVLDLEMPHLNGRDILARVRKNLATHALPVVVLTGVEGEESEAQLMELGADDYLHKPIDSARFAARVTAALRCAGG